MEDKTTTKPKATAKKRPRGRPPKRKSGGPRPMAGRKPTGNAKVRQQLYVSQLTKDRCAQLREKGFDFSSPFEKMIEDYAKVLGIE